MLERSGCTESEHDQVLSLCLRQTHPRLRMSLHCRDRHYRRIRSGPLPAIQQAKLRALLAGCQFGSPIVSCSGSTAPVGSPLAHTGTKPVFRTAGRFGCSQSSSYRYCNCITFSRRLLRGEPRRLPEADIPEGAPRRILASLECRW